MNCIISSGATKKELDRERAHFKECFLSFNMHSRVRTLSIVQRLKIDL